MTDNKYIRATEICIAVAKRGQRISPQQLAAFSGLTAQSAEAITMMLEFLWDMEEGTILTKEERNETGGEENI